MMKDLTIKDIRKVAFAVGLGITVGKGVGALVNAGIDGVIAGTFEALADHDVGFAQKVCEKVNVDYKKSSDDKSNIVGFHAE